MASTMEETDDCDVIWKGSPLYNHLQHIGMAAEEEEIRDHEGTAHLTPSPHEDECPIVAGETMLSKEDDENSSAQLVNSAKSFMWPDGNSLVLEVEVAKAILSSELLVQEDEEFLTNFVLTEEVMAEYTRLIDETPSKSSSLFSDIVLFSGSVAAVAGAVLYLSEKAKAATAAAAILPTALAAMTSVRIGSKVQQSHEEQHFHQLIELLLSDMKQFKQLVRKSLNLLQGMEMISSGNFLSVNPNTGATMVSTSPSCSTSQTTADDRNQLAQALCLRSNFPALRQAALKCTVQIIQAYRESVKNLMEVSPLADHVDMQEHYIAFIEMENFGIAAPTTVSNGSGEAGGQNPTQITIRELKETAQVALVQQSEYLRRFSLAFCDRVRDDHELNKAGVLKHIRDLLSTIRKLNNKLSKVLEYHQAMGFDVEKISERQDKNKALVEKSSPSRSRGQAKFVPLRGIYTSMFSTGLHLQHTLLKLRKLEQYFDEVEKSHKTSSHRHTPSALGRSSSPFPVDEVKLLTWLGGFKEIQAELNACIGCLDEGVCQIDALQNRTKDETQRSPSSTNKSISDLSSPSSATIEDDNTIYMDETSEVRAFDEVFEAMSLSVNELNGSESLHEDDGNEEAKEMNRQSKILMRELRGVLVHKAREHEFREAQALARQKNEPFGPMDGFTLPSANAFDDSFVDGKGDGDSSTSSSDPSDCTVKSIHVTNSSAVIARSVSGQLLESDDNEGLETTEGDVTYAEIGTDIEDFDQSELCQAVSLSSIVDSSGQNYDNHDTDELSSCKSSAVGGVRSVSTPDLKNLVDQSTQSGYKKFAAAAPLMSQDSEDVHSSSSSSGWESADELEHHVTLKTYRRPLRATAAAQAATKGSATEDFENKRRKRLRQKRERNRSNVNYEPSNGIHSSASGAASSHYLRLCEREGNEVHLPNIMPPTGFAGLLNQVTEKAKSMRNGRHTTEEIIGDSSSSGSENEDHDESSS